MAHRQKVKEIFNKDKPNCNERRVMSTVSKVSTATAVSTASKVSATSSVSTVYKASTASAISAASTRSSASKVSTASALLQYKIRCQDCSLVFKTDFQYFKHVTTFAHTQMLGKLFGKGEGGSDGFERKGWTPRLGLYEHLKHSLKQQEPVVGVSLVVIFISTEAQVEPLYLCFACEECFGECSLRQHFNSQKHVIHTLLYQNPWRLPFAWENFLDVRVLRSVAWEEERERGPAQQMLKVLDVPYRMIRHCHCSYTKVMASLELHHTLLKREVPKRETYSKLKDNMRFPQLGKQFLVMHSVYDPQHQSTFLAFLCLLCSRKLSDEECYAHVFSREHVASFLEHFHPGSLNSNSDAEILDLAKQAVRIHSISHMQEISMDRPIRAPYSFNQAISILTSVKKRDGNRKLTPSIIPYRKLVPRNNLEDVDKCHVRKSFQEISQMMEGSEKQIRQKCVESSDTSQKESFVVGRKITSNCCAESGIDKDVPTPSEEDSEQREVLPKTHSEEIRKADCKTLQVIKQKNKEEPILNKPTGEITEGYQNTDKVIKKEFQEEKSKSCSHFLKQTMNYTSSKNKRKLSSMSDKSQDNICPNENEEKGMDHKRQRLHPKHKSACQQPQNLQIVEEEDTPTDDKVDGKPSHKTVKNIAIQELKSQENGLHERPSTSAVSPVQQVDVDDFQVVEMGIDESKDSEAEPSSVTAAVSIMTETISKTTEVFPISNEDAKMFGSADNTATCLTIHRRKEVPACLRVLTDTTSVHPNSTQNYFKAEITSNTTVAPFEKATTSKIVGKPQNAATSDSAVTTSTKAMTAISKAAKFPNLNFIKSTTPNSSVRTGTSRSTSTTTTTTFKSSLRETKSKFVPSTSSATSTTTKQPAANNDPITGAKVEKSSNSEFVSSTMAIFQSVASSFKCGNTESSANTMKKSVEPNDVTPKCTPATPHSTMHVSVRSENKNAPKEPSHGSAGNMKQSKSTPKVGINQLIVVSCKTKRQIYCRLCSVKLSNSKHLTEYNHKYNYVKKFFGCTAKPPDLEKLDKAVAHLAEAEKDVGSRNIQTVEVKRNTYEELHALPVDKALERLKEMLRRRDSQVSSTIINATEDIAFASLCKASSTDDENESNSAEDGNGAVVQSDRAHSTKNSEREDNQSSDQLHSRSTLNKSKPEPIVTPSAQVAEMAEIESTSTDDGNGAVGQSDRANTMWSSEQEDNQSPDRLHSGPTLNKSEQEPLTTTSGQVAEMAVTVKQRTFECDEDYQAVFEVTPAAEISAVEMGRNYRWENTFAAGTFAQIVDTTQETAKTGQGRTDPDLQHRDMSLEGTQKTSEKFSSPDPLPSAASVNTEQEQSGPSHSSNNVTNHSGCSPRPPYYIASQSPLQISIGERSPGPSNLSVLSKVMNRKPIIGLSSIWECRGISSIQLPSFYLCESCVKKISIEQICNHIVSSKHHLDYARKQYPQFMWFWEEKDLPLLRKMDILKGVVKMLSQRESFNMMDAQVVLLREDLYKRIQEAPISDAVKIVQSITKEPNESLFRTLQEYEERQKTRKHHVEETVVDGNLDEDKCQRVSSPLDVASISSKANSVVSLLPGADTCHSPQDTCRGLCVQPQLKLSVSQHQKPVPELQVKQAEVHLESPSSCLSHKTRQTASVSPKDECPPTRKRPAVISLETLILKPDTNNPKLDDPLPDKHSQPNTESASGSTCVNSAAASTPPSPENKKEEPQSDEQEKFNGQYTNLIALVKKLKSDIACKSSLDNAGIANSYANNSSHTDVKSRHEYVQALSTMANKLGGFDSMLAFFKATTKPNSPPTAPSLVPCEDQLIASETEANGVNIFHSASTSEPGESQHQLNVNAQSMFGNLNHFKPSDSVATNHNPVQILQPQGHVETNFPKTQLPINSIITPRPEPVCQYIMGGYTGQNHPEVNRDHQLAHSFATLAAVNPSDRGQYGHYDQMVYVTNGPLSTWLSAEALAGYTRQDDPLTYNRSSYQLGGYPPRVCNPSQIYPEQNSNQLGQLATLNTLSRVESRDEGAATTNASATTAPASPFLVKWCPGCEKKQMDQ